MVAVKGIDLSVFVVIYGLWIGDLGFRVLTGDLRIMYLGFRAQSLRFGILAGLFSWFGFRMFFGILGEVC